jgi:plastocyanin
MENDMMQAGQQKPSVSGGKAWIWVVIAVLAIILGAVAIKSFSGKKAETGTNGTEPTNITAENENATGDHDDGSVVPIEPSTGQPAEGDLTNVNAGVNVNASVGVGETKTFEVHAGNFKFSLDEIRVKKGDRVKIVFTNDEGFHDWVIDEFNARTQRLQAVATETVEFVANKSGTFEYYCSVGQHRQFGMRGNLIVE